MDESSKINALVNIGQSKVAENAYNDILSSPSKKMGNALSTVVDIGNTLLWPIKWANERTRIFFENNLRKYEKKLSAVDEDKIIPVPSEIAIPILERFVYVSNEDLSNAFVNLLSSSSNSETANLAHPGFISIIDRICPDEAKIIKFVAIEGYIPCLTFCYYKDKNRRVYVKVLENKTGIEKTLELSFPVNVDIYFDNLCSLGLIERTHDYYDEINTTNAYNNIEEVYSELIEMHKPDNIQPDENVERRIIREKSMFRITNFGQLFIQSCIENNL